MSEIFCTFLMSVGGQHLTTGSPCSASCLSCAAGHSCYSATKLLLQLSQLSSIAAAAEAGIVPGLRTHTEYLVCTLGTVTHLTTHNTLYWTNKHTLYVRTHTVYLVYTLGTVTYLKTHNTLQKTNKHTLYGKTHTVC